MSVSGSSVVAYADSTDKATHGPNLTTVADLVAAGGGGGGGGAPTNAEFITYAANATLSNERVATDNTEVTLDVSTPSIIKFVIGAIAQSKITNLVTDLAAKISSTRTISTTAPLTGGGDLSADRTLAISDATTTTKGAVELATDGEAVANVVVQGNDSRLSNSRTPTAHASSHASIGSDPITIAESQVTNLVSDLSGKAPTSRSISTNAPLSGGGDLSADRTLSVATFSNVASGVVPASGGGTANFLRADGTWNAPAGGSGLTQQQSLALVSLRV